MSMNNKADNAYLNQYTDNVIKRGFEIYDEWIDKKYNSRKIRALSENSIKLFNKRKTMDALIDALAYLFALDMRIKEKYNSILRCLFSYFSWRKETRLLEFLKRTLNLPLGEKDIRNAIAIEIERLAEQLEDGWHEDGDDDTHGGKRNGKSDEEATASEERGKEQAKEEKAEKSAKAEETEENSEEKTEEPSEKADDGELIKEDGEKQQDVEHLKEEFVKETQDAKDQKGEEKQSESKEEKNIGAEEKSEPNKDKSNEVRSYNDAVDSPPIYESAKESKHVASENKTSIIDEFILNDIAGARENFTANNRANDVNSQDQAQRTEDAATIESVKDNSTDKDAYLHDKVQITENSPTSQNSEITVQEKNEIKQGDENTAQEKNEIKQDTAQNNEHTEPKKEEMRVPLQVDITAKQENDMRIELSLDMSTEVVEVIKATQSEYMSAQLAIMYEEAMRAKLNITELSEEPPVQVAEKPEIVQTHQPSVLHRK